MDDDEHKLSKVIYVFDGRLSAVESEAVSTPSSRRVGCLLILFSLVVIIASLIVVSLWLFNVIQ